MYIHNKENYIFNCFFLIVMSRTSDLMKIGALSILTLFKIQKNVLILLQMTVVALKYNIIKGSSI